MGDGMGGGRNGLFWGAPILGQDPGKYSIFPQRDAKSRGAPKTAAPTTHPIHHLTPSDIGTELLLGPMLGANSGIFGL